MTSPTLTTLTYHSEQGIATVMLNRPAQKNAMSFIMMRELVSIAKHIRRDRSIRAVILRGASGTFCSGIDLSALKTAPKAWVFWELIKPGRSLFQHAMLIWRDLPVPVIATVEGYCLGAGAQLALAADVTITTADCQWAIREVHWGLVPDMGITQSGRGRVSIGQLKARTFSAGFFDGQEAAAEGFADQVAVDPGDTAKAFAKQISARSPDAVLASKRIINATYRAPFGTLYREKWWQLKLLLGKNQRRAVKRGNADAPDTVSFNPRQYR